MMRAIKIITYLAIRVSSSGESEDITNMEMNDYHPNKKKQATHL